jgi:hypothetical protein
LTKSITMWSSTSEFKHNCMITISIVLLTFADGFPVLRLLSDFVLQQVSHWNAFPVEVLS